MFSRIGQSAQIWPPRVRCGGWFVENDMEDDVGQLLLGIAILIFIAFLVREFVRRRKVMKKESTLEQEQVEGEALTLEGEIAKQQAKNQRNREKLGISEE